MSGASSAREALIAEVLGEMAALLDRLEAVAPALDTSRRALIHASTELSGQLTAFESRMAAITDNAKVQAIHHLARRSHEVAQRTLSAQTQAMEAAARTVLQAELGPALQRVSAQLRPPDQRTSRFERWRAHAATAGVASLLTWAATWLCAR